MSVGLDCFCRVMHIEQQSTLAPLFPFSPFFHTREYSPHDLPFHQRTIKALTNILCALA